MRNLDPAMAAALSSGVLVPCMFVDLTFASGAYYVWTGYGPFVFNGHTYIGAGQVGEIGKVSEGLTVRADSMTISLSGIDPTLYQDCLDDIQIGALTAIHFALLAQGIVIGSPYTTFAGIVGKPTLSPGADAITITLELESRMVNLQRPSGRRYTAADQHLTHPDDTGFGWVEQQADIALNWHS